MSSKDDCEKARKLLLRDKQGKRVKLVEALAWLETLVLRCEDLEAKLATHRAQQAEAITKGIGDAISQAKAQAKAQRDEAIDDFRLNNVADIRSYLDRIASLTNALAMIRVERDALRERERTYRVRLGEIPYETPDDETNRS